MTATEQLLWEDGAHVIASARGFWDGGDGFVPGWGRAKLFRPCTDQYLEGIAEAERRTGEECWVGYIFPDVRSVLRSTPE